MFLVREASLVHLYAQRRLQRGVLLIRQEIVVRALDFEAKGEGRGPSELDMEQLVAAMIDSQMADDAYLRMLVRVSDDIIASTKASSRSRTGK